MAGSERQARPPKGQVHFDAQSMEDLGFLDIRGLLEDFCKTDSAKRRARDLTPTTHRPTVLEALDSTDGSGRIRVEGYTFPALVFEEIKAEIKLLEVSGSALTEAGFMRVLQCTRLVNDIIGALQGRERAFPRLCGMLGTVHENTEIVQEIEAVFDPRAGFEAMPPQHERIRIDMQTARRAGVNRLFDKALRACSPNKVGWPIPKSTSTNDGYSPSPAPTKKGPRNSTGNLQNGLGHLH